MEPRLIADYACVCGEGPLWHPIEERVYWTDIETDRMFRYDPATGQHEMFLDGETVGGFTIQADGSLLLFMDKGAVKIWRDEIKETPLRSPANGGSLVTVVEEIPTERDSRFNDVIADPMGRVFCGTMPAGDRLGRLWRLDTDGTLTPVVDEVKCSNGMGFTPDRTGMYFTDSERYEITLFDYDKATGNLSNRRLFVRSAEADGFPDGMTVDAEGYVWSAHWDGSCLIRYAPDGTEERRIRFPAKKVSSVTFGGSDLTDMIVTTAGGDQKKEEGTGAGALFLLNVGIRGVPEFMSRIGM